MNSGRHATAVIFALLGTAVMGTALVVMNAKTHRPPKAKDLLEAEINVREKKKPPKKKSLPKPKPRPRRARPNPAPRPTFGSQLAGLGAGIPVFSAGDLAGLTGDVMSGVEATKDLVMTAETVDAQPDCRGQRPPTPPGRAIKRGLTGYVKARALIDANGRLQGIKIVEAQPEEVFDDAVIAALSAWVCQPATYGGQKVSMSYDATFTFR